MELRLSFQETTPGLILPTRRQLDLNRLRDGDYIVQVTVEGGGRRLVRRAPVTIHRE